MIRLFSPVCPHPVTVLVTSLPLCLLLRCRLHYVPLNVLKDMQKSKLESTNAASVVKCVQVTHMSTAQVNNYECGDKDEVKAGLALLI